jgi:peroxiredoxin
VLRIVDPTLLAARLLLSAVFLFAGTAKLINRAGLRKALRDFGLPSLFGRPLAVLLPFLELSVAAVLLPTRLAWYGAWGALALLLVFLLAICVAMLRGRKPDCQCFGQLHSAPVGWLTLVRNGILAALAGWLVSRGQLRMGPDVWGWLAGLDAHARKVALVAGCMMGFLFFRLLDRSRPELQPAESQTPPTTDSEGSPEERSLPAEGPASGGVGPMGIGLPIGTPAPDFELPAINGEKHSLQSLRADGKDLLLVFSSPYCEPCQALASNLVRWMREMEGLPKIILVSRGTPQENLAKLKGFDPSKALLQRASEVADTYDCASTPAAVLVDKDGLIRSDLAVAAVAIKRLLSSCAKPCAAPGNPEVEKEAAQS